MRLLVGSRSWQAACLQEEIVRLLVVNVGLALSDLVLRYGAELDGFQHSSFKLDIGDHAFPIDWFVEIYQCRRQLEDEIAAISAPRELVPSVIAPPNYKSHYRIGM
jgi:hypothetical protein